MKFFSILKTVFVLVFAKLFAGDLFTDDWDGYGEGSKDEVRELIKALQANEGETDISALEGGEALQLQSLERSLALLTFDAEDMAIWQNIGKEKAFSTLEEYSTQDAYGSEGSFMGQLENAEEDDPNFNRQYAVVKFLRQTWRVADVLGMTNNISNAEVLAVQGAMMRALRDCNKALYFGNSSIIPQQFDGLLKVVEDNFSDNVIDIAGADITELNFRDGAQIIQENFGKVTDCYTSLGGQTAIDNILLNNSAQRYYQSNVPSELGAPIKGMTTSFGNFTFRPDRFLNIEGQDVPTIKQSGSFVEGATSKKAPATPTFTATAVAPTVTGSLWAATGRGGAIAGDYKYKVVAINNYGKSQATAASSAVTVAAGGAVDIVITAGSGPYAPTGYEIYRETTPDSGVYRFMKKIAKSATATTTHRDLNVDLPGRGIMFLVDGSSAGPKRTMTLSQLAPIHRTRYAKIGPYNWGAVNYYVVPKWYAPGRFVIFKNVRIPETGRSQVIDL